MGVTPKQFAEMAGRVSGKRPVAEAVFPSHSGPGAQAGKHKIVLGIDPSLRGTGFGVVRAGKPRMQSLGFGVAKSPAGWQRSRCLVHIAAILRDAIRKYQPTVCAVEGLFFAQNLQTAQIMGEARGVCMLCAAEAGLEIIEIAPRKVKQAIVGYGAAQKLAVAKMVARMLGLAEPPPPDAADALALALAYLQENQTYSLSPLKKL
jgi:crossover junction endodeoxyribonuclease RuvC